ncbi:MAG TPA: Cof-type HAD-IIB family hydrolase [Candidatus Binataceae bacterium]|nr:Cof-type HAD-IIB family hydrolase [Candidatus Binataceae bacterium]
MRYRALAIDLDGTLLHSDERVTPRSLDALRAARAAGFKIIIATARWYQMAERIAREIGAQEPIIACAGAQVRRPTDKHDLLDLRIPEEFAQRLYHIVDTRRCIASIALDDAVLVKMDGNPDVSGFPAELVKVSKLSGAAHVAPRIALIQGSEATAHVVEHLGEQWKDRVRFVESFSSRRKSMLTLTAAGADKGAALAVACADMDIPTAEVVAFGDAEADIEMFRVAGSSVAMGQASDHVKSFATAVTLSNDEDGVALAVERLLERGTLAPLDPR